MPVLNKHLQSRAISALPPTFFLFVLFVAGSCQALEITDHEGTVHSFAQPFRRIISLYPAHTENLVEMGGSEALIGISSNDTLPGIERERFSYHDSAEKFIAAKPDCILIRPMISRSTPNLIRKLRQFGITIISLQPTSFEQLYSYWLTLGQISGRSAAARQMVDRFDQKLLELTSKITTIPPEDRPRVYFEAIHERMKTFSPDSITMFCLLSAGGINVADDAVASRGTNIANYGKERILSRGNSIDVYLAQSGRMNRITVPEIVNEPGFGAIRAVRDRRVYLVSEKIVSRPTTKLMEGMLRIHHLLYQPPDQ
jgi:iron complex transport system substrate-binding protein